MSKKDNVTETPQEEKIVTRYDRKMQKRREQEEKDKREQKIIKIVTTVIAAAILALIVSFPIRNIMAVNETYAIVDGEKINKVEFDYYYNAALSNYYNQYGMYLSYMGVDLTGDLTTQWYSDNMTWDQYIEYLAIENFKQNKALVREAKAEGFEYDTAAKWDEYNDMLKEQASEAAVSFNTYIKSCFGTYATMGRLKNIICDSMLASGYSTKISEEKAPTDEEIVAYYEENKDDYDSVDYLLVTVKAELPTEPTELADPVEETESTEEASDAEEAEEEEYEPSEAEIEAAMAEAKKQAEEAEKTVMTEGDLKEDYAKVIVNSNYSDWLFDDARKEGDTTIVEDTSNNRYFVVGFVKKYLPEEPTVNARIIMTSEDPQAILDEWTAGAATEESFIELYKKYSLDTTSTEDGLYEGLTASGLITEMSDWLFAEDRKAGDTIAITQEGDSATNYVIYYHSQGDVEWKLEIKSTLLSTAMSEYIAEITEGMEVEDPKGNLEYIAILEAAAAEAEAAAESETAETTAE